MHLLLRKKMKEYKPINQNKINIILFIFQLNHKISLKLNKDGENHRNK